MPILMPPTPPSSGNAQAMQPAVDDAALQQAWQASALAQALPGRGCICNQMRRMTRRRGCGM
jgi:hypothetical protein